MSASSNFGNVFSVLVASAFLPFLPMLPLQLLMQNLLYDISQIGIPFDNVDPERVAKPLQRDPEGVGRFMLFLGPISSLYDLVTFAVMWWVFEARTIAQQSLFQSGWFVVGLLTQTLIVHMIHTPGLPFIRIRPSAPLTATTRSTIGSTREPVATSIPSAGLNASIPPESALGLLVALGGGLLIGLERERRKGQGDTRKAAGLRTFAVVTSCGALAQSISSPGLVVAGGALVAVLAIAGHLRSRSLDPGLTTEVALFAAYLIGVQSVVSPSLGAGCAVVLAALLAARSGLHRFATDVLSEQELHDGLLLAGFALVLLPLIPGESFSWLGGISPRPLAALVLLILSVQALAHVAMRLLGPRAGTAAAGFLAGFASSTAAIASLGARVRRHPASTGSIATGAALSTAATWVQAPLIAVALSPGAARVILPAMMAGLIAALGVGAALGFSARRESPLDEAAPRARTGAISLREALAVAASLSIVTLVVAEANRRFGSGGVLTSASIAGLADAHAAVVPLSALFGSGQLAAPDLVTGVLLAISFNSLTRLLVAFVAGGPRYGWRVGTVLFAGNASAWVAAVSMPMTRQ